MKKLINLLLLVLLLSAASCGDPNGNQQPQVTQACNQDNPTCPKDYVCINHAGKGTVFLCAKLCDLDDNDKEPITVRHPVHTNNKCANDLKTECVETQDYAGHQVAVCNPHAYSIQ